MPDQSYWWTKAWPLLGFLQLTSPSALQLFPPGEARLSIAISESQPSLRAGVDGEVVCRVGRLGDFSGLRTARPPALAGHRPPLRCSRKSCRTPARCPAAAHSPSAGVKCWEGTTTFLGILSQRKHITAFAGRLSKCINFDYSMLTFLLWKVILNYLTLSSPTSFGRTFLSLWSSQLITFAV